MQTFVILGTTALDPGPDGLWVDRDGEIGAVFAGSGVLIGWIDTAWPGPHTPVTQLQDVRHVVDRESGVAAVIEELRAARGRAFRTCRYCKCSLLPGQMHGDVCHGCAEQHLGVVH